MSNGVKYDDKDSIKNEKRRNNNKNKQNFSVEKFIRYCESMIIQGAMRKTMIEELLVYIRFFKRLCDFCISLVCSIIFLPIFIILIIVVKLDSKGPVFFCQERVGKDKKLFHILKFRTMKVDTPKETPTCMLENPEQYITRVGKFLRKNPH